MTPTKVEAIRRLQLGLRRLSQELHRLNDAVGSHIDLLPGDLGVLDLIDREGPISPREVSQLTGIHPATLTGVLDRLERGGWATRQPDPIDRRKTVLETIPDRGGELFRLYAPMSQALAAICAGYSSQELAVIVDFVEKAAAAGERATRQVRSTEES
jgi:DNA-binding MarR family transcriptional regulator